MGWEIIGVRGAEDPDSKEGAEQSRILSPVLLEIICSELGCAYPQITIRADESGQTGRSSSPRSARSHIVQGSWYAISSVKSEG